MIHSSINICNEIEYISKKYEVLMESDSYYAMNKNKDIIAILNVHFKEIKELFNKYAIKKEKVDPTEMTADKFYAFFQEIYNLCNFDIVKLGRGDVKTDYNIDIFDFLRKIVGMAINLTAKPEDNQENNNPGIEKKDQEYIGLTPEAAVEKFLEDILTKFREKDMKEAAKKSK